MSNLIYTIYRHHTMEGEDWYIPLWETPFKDDVSLWMEADDFYMYEIEVTHRNPHTHQEIELEVISGTDWKCRESDVL